MNSRASTFRKNGAGITLLIAPLLFLAYDIAEMPIEFIENSSQQLQEFADNLGSVRAVAILFPLGQLMLIPGIFAIVHLIRERGVGLAHAGGTLVVAGLFGHAVFSGSQLVTVEMAALDASNVDFARLLDATKESPALNVFAAMGLLGFALGFIVLGFAVLRSGSGPWWIGASMILSILLEFGGSGLFPPLGTAGVVLLSISLGYFGIRLLRMPVGEWITRVRMDA